MESNLQDINWRGEAVLIIKHLLLLLTFTLSLQANLQPFSYTPSGQIKQVTDNSGTITYTYDNRGRVKSITNQDNESINYTYDNVGNITKIETPTTTISKTYTKRNELESVTDASGTTSYVYDALGREIEINYANSSKTIKEYDSKNQIVNITHYNADAVVLSSFSYDYDANGNRTKIVEQDSRTTEYTYDNTNRLTSESVTNDPDANNYTITYNYDEVGNLLTKTVDSTTTEFTYNNNDQLISDGVDAYIYDLNGNLISKGDTTYTYDSKNRLISVTTPTDAIEYTYDANNNRIAKTINANTTSYLVDANTQYAKVLQESNSTNIIGYTYGNSLLQQTSVTDTYTYHTDALGSTRYLTDQETNTKAKYNYDAYGNLLNQNNQEVANNFLYTGEQLDKETQNYYLRARYYDPQTTRFISRDTYDGVASNPITQNHYLYGNANPMMYTDPSGNMSMLSLSANISMRGVIVNTRTHILGQAQQGFFKTFGCDLMSFVAEESIRAGIYLYMADGFGNDQKPYVGKTSRKLRTRLKEHLDKSPWKKNTKKKLKSMSHSIERFHFKINDDELLETIEQVILDAIGGVDKTANKVEPMGGRRDRMPDNIDKIKKIICKGK